MKTIEISQKLRKELSKELKPDRFDHTLGVAYTASSMAFVHGADSTKALIAGMLHDCAKCMSHEEQIKICEKNNIDVTDIERRNHSLLHAKVGMYLARTKYDVYDTEILNAIRWHTTGREDMSLLEKIIYIAIAIPFEIIRVNINISIVIIKSIKYDIIAINSFTFSFIII